MPTGRPIDHVAVAVHDLDRAARTYEDLGFTLTPRAYHPDGMGTSNRLAQFAGGNFIELVEVDRPELLDPHAFDAAPPRFGFGAHNKAYLRAREGLSMLAFPAQDVRAELAGLSDLGLQTYAPLDFERKATLPDGSQVTVAFTLGFLTCPALPGLAFFICQDQSPHELLRPAYQTHRNGARALIAVTIATEDPDGAIPFLRLLTGGSVERIDGGHRVSSGGHEILVMTPERVRSIAPSTAGGDDAGPGFAGVTIRSRAAPATMTPPSRACGLFIAWQAN